VDERALLDLALSGDPAAIRRLVALLTPVVQVRVARILVRRRAGSGRDVRQEVADLTQEVFATLFSDGTRALRSWDPGRGLSLMSFCGLIAEREASSILRSGRRSPWTESATELEELEASLSHVPDAEMSIASREQLARVFDRLAECLSPRGLELFHRLIVEEETVESVCATTNMSADAVYAWRSRIGKVVRKLAAEIAASERRITTGTERSAASEGSSFEERR
jgi:RNA polymerase sigma-70 factor (ECF subfamily)